MKKYKLNKTRTGKRINDEEILRYKNFHQLKLQYEKVTKRPDKPMYKKPILFFVLVLIILLALLLSGEL